MVALEMLLSKMQALKPASTALFNRSSIGAITLGVSQALSGSSAQPLTEGQGWELMPIRLVLLTCVGEGGPGGRLERCGGQGYERAAEIKKAEGASYTALRIPSPPQRISNVAWIQEGSSQSEY